MSTAKPRYLVLILTAASIAQLFQLLYAYVGKEVLIKGYGYQDLFGGPGIGETLGFLGVLGVCALLTIVCLIAQWVFYARKKWRLARMSALLGVLPTILLLLLFLVATIASQFGVSI